MADDLPDFGKHQIIMDGKVMLEARYYVPGLTLHDLVKLYEDAFKSADPNKAFSANPDDWPTVRGVRAVADACIKALHK